MLISFLSLKLTISPIEIVAEKNEECNIILNLHNRFLIPASPIRIIGDFQNLSDNEIDFSKKILMTDAAPVSVTPVGLLFRLPFRGEYTVIIYEYSVYDLLKIFRLRKKLDLTVKILVLPKDKTPIGRGTETETDSESPASVITPHRSNTFNSLREYREGDSIRNIHWKLTAKQDELIVKQMEQSVNNSAVIFNDFTVDLSDEYFTRRMLDAVLETSLGITKKILLDSNSVINCWQGEKESEKYEAIEFSHYSYLHGAFTVLPQIPSERQFAELITLFSPEIQEHHTIYVITPLLRRELLNVLEETGLSIRSGVTIITFSAIKTDDEIIEYINDKTKVKLIEIDDMAAEFSLD
jgi:hypothetical protein